MDIKEIALALAKANRHPDPEGYAEAVERAANGQAAWPEDEQPAAEQPAAE